MSDFERIAREHRPRLVRFARRFVASDAEDVAQIALLKAWQKFGAFEGRNLAGWLNEITRNTAFDFLKNLKRHKRRPEGGFTDLADEDGHMHEVPETEHIRDVARACDRLSDKQRAALELAALGYTYPEIGRELGCSADAARDRVARARAAVLEHLN